MNGNDIDHVALFRVTAFSFAFEGIEKHLFRRVGPGLALRPTPLWDGRFDATGIEWYLLVFVGELIWIAGHLIGRINWL
jgi:hypothetical protein